jgi:hypothetical protein
MENKIYMDIFNFAPIPPSFDDITLIFICGTPHSPAACSLTLQVTLAQSNEKSEIRSVV